MNRPRQILAVVVFSLASLFASPTRATALCSTGDLVYHAAWEGINEVPDWEVGVDMLIWVMSDVVAQDWAQNWEYVNLLLEADIHACNNDQAAGVQADFYVYYPYEDPSVSGPSDSNSERRGWWIHLGYMDESVTLPGAGPGSVTVSMAAFIPEEWLWEPGYDAGCVIDNIGPSPCYLAGGDNRSFSYYGASARMSTIIDVYNTGINNEDVLSGPYHSVGLSSRYDAFFIPSSLTGWFEGDLKQEAKDDWEAGPPLKAQWGFASTSGMSCDAPTRLGTSVGGAGTSAMEFNCSAAANYPFVLFSPAIDWEYDVRLTFGNNGFDWRLTGCSDGFPNHEVYLNGTAIREFNHETFLSLFPLCEINVNLTGSIR